MSLMVLVTTLDPGSLGDLNLSVITYNKGMNAALKKLGIVLV